MVSMRYFAVLPAGLSPACINVLKSLQVWADTEFAKNTLLGLVA